MELIYWLLFYLVPATATIFLKKVSDERARRIHIHSLGVVSIVLLSIVGIHLVWGFSTVAVVFFVVAFLFSLLGLRMMGPLYVLSSIIQEIVFLLGVLLLATQIDLFFAAVLTIAPLVFAHRISNSEWIWKPFVLFLWGLISVYLYVWLQQPLINISLHIIFGSLLMRRYLPKQT